MLGFNFYEKSPRYIKVENAKKIILELPNTVTTVGIFVDETKEKINETSLRIKKLQKPGDVDDGNKYEQPTDVFSPTAAYLNIS